MPHLQKVAVPVRAWYTTFIIVYNRNFRISSGQYALYTRHMDAIQNILNMVLGFLLSFLTLIINFFISILELILHFAQSLVGAVS